ncbi:MAG TPA: DUF4339 domain-containing protein [Verrucomicrobiota bacterium]|nr:DUF4339 domain-containing protein [Verrucomicrobiota bacterium]
MYKIIGADGRQYGPATQEQVHQWIAQGRANAQTQVQVEGTSEWRPLGSLPEFADAVGSAVPPTVPYGAAGASSIASDRQAALDAVRPPAITLMIVGGLMLVYLLYELMAALLGYGDPLQGIRFGDPALEELVRSMSGVVRVVTSAVAAGLAVVMLVGAARMQSLRSYGMAITASVIAMLPCTLCCVLGLPAGIWALVVLNRPEVKNQFQ